MNLLIEYDTTKYQLVLPDSWEGVTRKDWRAVMLLRQAMQATYSEVKPPRGSLFIKPRIERTGAAYASYPHFVDALFTATNWPKKLVVYITPDVCSAIIDEVKWCVDAPQHWTNMLPRIGVFKGVKSQLANMTWEQYAFAEEAFQDWKAAAKAQDEVRMVKAEKKLFAVLYTPFFYWAPWIGSLNKRLSFLVKRKSMQWSMLNYIGMREWLMNTYQYAFPKQNVGAAEEEIDEPSDDMRRLTISLSGTKFGNVKQTRKANLHDVMIFLNEAAEARLKSSVLS